jgi:hypothetical protein
MKEFPTSESNMDINTSRSAQQISDTHRMKNQREQGDGEHGDATPSTAVIGARGNDHQGFPPRNQPVRPMRAAPARFGKAGISAGYGNRIKETVTLPGGPLLQRRILPDGRIVRDQALPGSDAARGLGWFSIALGLTEVFGAEPLANWLGMRKSSPILRAHGVRELGHGLGILSQDRQDHRAMWVWSRVAGDALDLSTLVPGLSRENPKRQRVVGAIAAVVGVAAVDILTALQMGKPNGASDLMIHE